MRTLSAMLAAMLAAVLLVTACGSDGASGADPIQLLLFGGPEEIAGYQRMLDAFAEVAPDNPVQLTPVPDQEQLLAKLTTSFAGDNPPDVFLINFRKYGQFADQGAIRPVQPFLDASTELGQDDFVDTSVDAFRFDDDELTCQPQNISSLVTYVNVDRFEAAGLGVPYDGWDWDEFVAAAEALTDADAGSWGLGIAPELIRLAPFVWSNGGELVDDTERPTQLTLTEDPATREALDWFLDLQLVHGVVPPDADEQSRSAEQRFLDGTLGMYLDSRKAVPDLRTIEDFQWDVVPLPVAPGGEAVTILHADAYCIAAGTGNEERAWQLIEFAMSRRGQEILAESGRTVPSRRDVLDSPLFRSPDEPPRNAEVYVQNAEIARATPTIPTWVQVEKLGDDLLADVFYGRVEREPGIQRLVERTRPLFGGDGG